MGRQLLNTLKVVQRSNQSKSCVLKGAIERGEVIATLSGKTLRQPNRFTIQLSENVHLEIKSGLEFTNHSCQPNTMVVVDEWNRALRVVAMKSLQEGDELFFNYNTTEWDMDEKFECSCGACTSPQTIGGAKYLQGTEITHLLPYFTPVILRQLCQKLNNGSI